MASNASRGAYYKNRTRKYLEARGFVVFDMETVRWVGKPGANRIPIKRDQLASDLGAMNAMGIIFVQVKSGNVTGNFPEAKRKFAEYPWPAGLHGPHVVRRQIYAWAPRARAPRIVEC